jgi:hypothetical protein
VTRFLFLEPNKTGKEHVTLIDGYLYALECLKQKYKSLKIEFYSSKDLDFDKMAITNISVSYIHVLDGHKKQLIRKSITGVGQVLRRYLGTKKGEIIFVSCLWSSELFVLELIGRFFGQNRADLYVLLHGDIEDIFHPPSKKPLTFGYWIQRWLSIRSPHSKIKLVVLADFIRRELLSAFPGKFREEDIHVVPLPLAINADKIESQEAYKACFIGFRKTPNKGYARFLDLASNCSSANRTFLAIGQGVVEDVATGRSSMLLGGDGYIKALMACDVGVFPYVGGYRASLSAALMDAIAAGIHVVASPRNCFVQLHHELGPDFITICETDDAFRTLLNDNDWLAKQRASRALRLARLNDCAYSRSAIVQAFEGLLTASGREKEVQNVA